MKVLITSDLYKPTINGVVTSICNLREELIGQGHEVRILTVSASCRSYQEDGVYHIRSIPSKIYPGVRIPTGSAQHYVKELIGWQPDVVHSQCEFFSFGYARRIAKATGARLIHTYHTLYEQYTEYLPFGKRIGEIALSKWMNERLKDVDEIIVPTAKVEQTLLRYEIKKPLRIIPTGIALKQYQKKIEQTVIDDCKAQYDIPTDKKILLSLGRLGYEKRVDELLYGMKEVLAGRQDIILLVVGDGPARESLMALSRELGIEESVRFTGMVSPQDTAIYYQMADVFVCASTSETQGLTYVEALASGLPLLCRKDDCLKDILFACKNGYAYETVDQFVSYVAAVFEESGWLLEAATISKRIANQYSTGYFAECVLESYQFMIKQEVENNESITVFKKPGYRFKEWCWTCYDYARRIS